MDYSKFVRKDMPLAVPHQKPPSKYASHLYAFYALGKYSTLADITSIQLRQAKIFELESIKASVAVSSITHTQLLFEPYYLNPQPHEQYKGSVSIEESGHSVTRVIFEYLPIRLGLYRDSYETQCVRLDSVLLTQLLFEPVRYKHPTPERVKTTTVIDGGIVTQKIFH